MVTIRTKVTLRRRGNLANHLAKIEKGVQGPKAVKVGFPKGKADADVVSIAIWNHFGTSRGIPARPFITIAMFKNRREIRAALRKVAKKTVETGVPIAASLPDLGKLGVNAITKQIDSNMPPRNAPSTVRQKGSDATLVDTGRMIGAVTWEVDR